MLRHAQNTPEHFRTFQSLAARVLTVWVSESNQESRNTTFQHTRPGPRSRGPAARLRHPAGPGRRRTAFTRGSTWCGRSFHSSIIDIHLHRYPLPSAILVNSAHWHHNFNSAVSLPPTRLRLAGLASQPTPSACQPTARVGHHHLPSSSSFFTDSFACPSPVRRRPALQLATSRASSGGTAIIAYQFLVSHSRLAQRLRDSRRINHHSVPVVLDSLASRSTTSSDPPLPASQLCQPRPAPRSSAPSAPLVRAIRSPQLLPLPSASSPPSPLHQQLALYAQL